MIYTNTSSKLTRKQRAKREALLKEQRAIKASMPSSKTYKPSAAELAARARARAAYDTPSVEDTGGVAAKKESPQYTGDAMIGIGQLHKSNAIPIFKQEDAEDLAKMRR